MKYKVLITTSGVGSGLGDLNKYTNKALIKIGDKPIISHIIENYDKKIEFVITLGYFGQHVKDFLQLAYPDRKFTFVWVDKYDSFGSSLVYSMIKASPQLQCPFIYNADDTIVSEKVPAPTTNWCGGFKGPESSKYTSFNVIHQKIQHMNLKGANDPDYLAIGLNSIHTYKSFWKHAKTIYKNNISNQGLSDIQVIDDLIKHHIPFKYQEFKSWQNTGSIEDLNIAKKNISSKYNVLGKPTESLFFIKNNVIKFFSDKKISLHRVQRANYLNGIVPKITDSRDNFYKYTFVKGTCYSKIANQSNFKKFLKWSKLNLWQPVEETTEKDFQKICYDFYYHKTQQRVDEFLLSRQVTDAACIINGLKVPTAKELLKKVDFKWLANSHQTTFHGDFILDNIIKTKKSFRLVDWRQDFGGLLKAGDIYYDLAKLNHNLVLNHELINNNQFSIKLLRPQRLVECQEYYFKFLKENKFDINKIKILTSIIWLNMSPLHEHPFDIFLFYFGKYNLLKSLNEYEKIHS
jgi:hypothetical protein